MDLVSSKIVKVETVSNTHLTGYTIELVIKQLIRLLKEGWVFWQSDYRQVDLRDTNVPLPLDCRSRESKLHLAADDPEMELIVAFAYAYSDLAHSAQTHFAATKPRLDHIFRSLSADHRNFNPEWFPVEYRESLKAETAALLASVSKTNIPFGNMAVNEKMYREIQRLLIRTALRIVFGSESKLLSLVEN